MTSVFLRVSLGDRRVSYVRSIGHDGFAGSLEGISLDLLLLGADALHWGGASGAVVISPFWRCY